MLSFQQLAQWRNIKASLAVEVLDGVCYKGFKPFNKKYIHHYLGSLHGGFTH